MVISRPEGDPAVVHRVIDFVTLARHQAVRS